MYVSDQCFVPDQFLLDSNITCKIGLWMKCDHSFGLIYSSKEKDLKKKLELCLTVVERSKGITQTEFFLSVQLMTQESLKKTNIHDLARHENSISVL